MDLHRVTTANAIYMNVAFVCEFGISHGCFISMENPPKNYMWQTRWLQKFIQKFALREIKFQQCMWGGKRHKWQFFFSNASWLQQLEKTCDWFHIYLPWGIGFSNGELKFNTAEEAEQEFFYVEPFLPWRMMPLLGFDVSHKLDRPTNVKLQDHHLL